MNLYLTAILNKFREHKNYLLGDYLKPTASVKKH